MSKTYTLIFFFLLIFSDIVLADDSVDYKALQDERMTLEKDLKKIVAEKNDISFLYLLGSVGYNNEHSVNISNQIFHGALGSIVGGWQAKKYFAMEFSLGYSHALYGRMGLKYSLLFQPYLKVNKSWVIQPKLGVGIGGYFGMIVVGDYVDPMPYGVDAFVVLGLRAHYKRFIFGVSYERGISSSFFSTAINDSVSAEAGIRF